LTAAPAGGFSGLTGGSDGGVPTIVQFKGEDADPNQRTGLSALGLDEYREVALVTAPAAPVDVAQAVRIHCENSKIRFAVLDSERNKADANTVDPRSDLDSEYAAFYYP